MNKTSQEMIRYPQQTAWTPLFTLHSELNQFLDDTQEWTPVCDVMEDEGHYLLTLEVPGIPKDQINIEILNRQLVITGERKAEERRNEKCMMYTERKFGQFKRIFSLPSGLDAEKIEARYENGLLKVMVPKAETARPRQIKISETN